MPGPERSGKLLLGLLAHLQGLFIHPTGLLIAAGLIRFRPFVIQHRYPISYFRGRRALWEPLFQGLQRIQVKRVFVRKDRVLPDKSQPFQVNVNERLWIAVFCMECYQVLQNFDGMELERACVLGRNGQFRELFKGLEVAGIVQRELKGWFGEPFIVSRKKINCPVRQNIIYRGPEYMALVMVRDDLMIHIGCSDNSASNIRRAWNGAGALWGMPRP